MPQLDPSSRLSRGAFAVTLFFIALLAACADLPPPGTCGQGEAFVDGVCAPVGGEGPCGAGAALLGARCVPIAALPVTACVAQARASGGGCVPLAPCAPGTHADVEGRCVAAALIDCGEGARVVDGACAPAPTCGPGAAADGGCAPPPTSVLRCGPGEVAIEEACVVRGEEVVGPIVTQEPDDPRFAPHGAPTHFTLAGAGEGVTLVGEIDPADFNGDGVVDQDVDHYVFHASAGQVIELRARDAGLAAPMLVVRGPDAETTLLRATPSSSAGPWRQLVIPRSGVYHLVVGAEQAMDDAPPQLVGGPDHDYSVRVETLDPVSPVSVSVAAAGVTLAGTSAAPAASAAALSPALDAPVWLIRGVSDATCEGEFLLRDAGAGDALTVIPLDGAAYPVPAPGGEAQAWLDWRTGEGALLEAPATLEARVEPLVAHRLPVALRGGADAGFHVVEAPGDAVFELALVLDAPTADARAEVALYDAATLRLLLTARDEDGDGEVSLALPLAQPGALLIETRDAARPGAGALTRRHELRVAARPIEALGALVAGATELQVTTAGEVGPEGAWLSMMPAGVVGALDVKLAALDPDAALSVTRRADPLTDVAAPPPVSGAPGEGVALPRRLILADGRTLLRVASSVAAPVSLTAALEAPDAGALARPEAVIDDGAGGSMTALSPLTIDGCGVIGRVVVGVDVVHDLPMTLALTLLAPDGRALRLAEPFTQPAPELRGAYPHALTPVDDLATLNDAAGDGTWRLVVEDTLADAHGGVLRSWSLLLACD